MQSHLVFAVVLVALGLRSSSARAGIIDIGPFVGDLTETWETFATTYEGGPYLSDPSLIMGGEATISSPKMAVYEPGVSDFYLGGQIGPALTADGVKGLGLDDFAQSATIDFDVAVSSFGAYWGAFLPEGSQPAVINVQFFDSDYALIGTEGISYLPPSEGTLYWHGWHIDESVSRIVYSGDGVVIDGLQAQSIPEPSVLCLFFVVFSWRHHRISI